MGTAYLNSKLMLPEENQLHPCMFSQNLFSLAGATSVSIRKKVGCEFNKPSLSQLSMNDGHLGI